MTRPKPKAAHISPDEMYNTAELRLRGIGELLLSAARRSGMVRPYEIGNLNWYDGAEVIAWMKTQKRRAG